MWFVIGFLNFDCVVKFFVLVLSIIIFVIFVNMFGELLFNFLFMFEFVVDWISWWCIICIYLSLSIFWFFMILFVIVCLVFGICGYGKCEVINIKDRFFFIFKCVCDFGYVNVFNMIVGFCVFDCKIILFFGFLYF